MIRTTIACLLVGTTLQSCAQKNEEHKALVPQNIYEVTKKGIEQTTEKYGLKGDVKMVEQKRYLVPKDSVVDLSSYEVSSLSEDAHHHLLAGAGMNNGCQLTFNKEGKLLYRMAQGKRFSSEAVETDTLHYNAKGDLVRLQNKLEGEDFAFHTNTIYDYDKKGHLLRQVNNDQPDVEYTYDEAKKQVRIVWHDNDQFMSDNLYTYDEFGRNIETHSYKEDGSLEVRWVREYDDQGHIKKETQYDPNGDSHESKKREEDNTIKVYRAYDEYGNCTKRLIVDSNGRITIRERKFEYYQ